MNLKNNFKDIVCDNTLMHSTMIAFSETWLEEGNSPSLEGYSAHFNSVGPGKGLAMFFKEDIFTHIMDVNKEKMQLTKLESSKIDVIIVYRSDQGNTAELIEHLIELITPENNTIICGDFNICSLATRKNRVTKYLEQNGFTQLVKEATHIQGRLLDQFYFRQSENKIITTSVF